MPSVIIKSAGMLTTVQDKGRYGYQRYGMPIAGAMDVFSLRLANLLVGNDLDAACLETTFTGPEIQFTADGAIATDRSRHGPGSQRCAGINQQGSEGWTGRYTFLLTVEKRIQNIHRFCGRDKRAGSYGKPFDLPEGKSGGIRWQGT